MLQQFSADLALSVIQFLSFKDAGRLAETCQRYYYMVHQYRLLLGPELVTVASWDGKQHKTARQVATSARESLQKAPNLVLAFSSTTAGAELSQELSQAVPPDAVVLGAMAANIQVCHNQVVEHTSLNSVMLASFPDAVIQPFSIAYGSNVEAEIAHWKQLVVEREPQVGWKAVLVYATGHGAAFIETFVSTMQLALPEAVIVGGMCGQGYVSRVFKSREDLAKMSVKELKEMAAKLGGMAMDNQVLEKQELVETVYSLSQTQGRLQTAEDSVYGVILGGETPVRSMVSRGVKSILDDIMPSSSFHVHDVSLVRPEDEEYIFRGSHLQPVHMIRSIKNADTGQVLPALQVMAKISDSAEFIGLKRPNSDGFELHMLSPFCQATGTYLIMTDGSPREEETLMNAELDFFVLNGEACLEDMEKKIGRLKQLTEGEEILGAVMVSCSGRGPQKGMLIPEDMADATRFAKGFPNVSCLGFYAGGEIGPLALAKMNESVFQTGRVAVQGFTAVFALFIVPKVELNFNLNDCHANVKAFVKSRISV